MRYWLTALILTGVSFISNAQDIPIFTHYYANPYIYNPAFAGIEGRSVVSLTHRRQWIGIEDAPVTSNFTFHTPLFLGLNFGLNVTQDNFGVFKSNGALITLGYTVYLGYRQYISFGLSGGGKFQNIDFTNINVSDPALANVLDKNAKLDGNAGIAYHVAGFTLGFSMQNIFNTETFPTTTFDTGTLGLVRNYMITADYMIYFGNDDYIFQPYGSYRSFEGFATQFEAGGIFHIKNTLWVGGSYKQDFGIIGLVGVKLKGAFSLGYAYEMPAVKANGINKTSHEIQLNLALGKKKKHAKKYATFLASAKPKKPKKKKKETKKEKEPIVVDTIKVEEEPVLPPVKEEITKKDTSAVLVTPVITKIKEPEITEATEEKQNEVIEEKQNEIIEDKTPKSVETAPEEFMPAVVAKKGSHPFEMNAGHYAVVGAFGKLENAIRMNDKLVAQGYDSDFGFNSDKRLFYVYIKAENTAEGARKKRDELRKKPEFSKAWYLLIEE